MNNVGIATGRGHAFAVSAWTYYGVILFSIIGIFAVIKWANEPVKKNEIQSF
jgi:hypothetical protein